MKADYSELNPKLDQRIIPLFPFKPHLWAFMRLTLFHPDYAPFVPFGEQITLAEFILNNYKGNVLTVGDLYYYTALYVEKKNPPPRGVRRSATLSEPKKSSLTSGLDDLFDEKPNTTDLILKTIKGPNEPETNTESALSALYDLFEDCAPPKEKEQKNDNRNIIDGLPDAGNGRGNVARDTGNRTANLGILQLRETPLLLAAKDKTIEGQQNLAEKAPGSNSADKPAKAYKGPLNALFKK